jgi:hypothetical protein
MCGAFQQHPVQAREPSFAVVAMAGPDEVHHALGRHVARIPAIPDAATFHQAVPRQELKLLELLLDRLGPEVEGSVKLPFP